MTMLSRRSAEAVCVLALLVVALNSCGTREVQVEGSVFIVTRGGGSVKLGLVEVRAIPEEIILHHIAARKSLAIAREPDLKAMLIRAQEDSSSADERVRVARDALHQAADRWDVAPSDARMRAWKDAKNRLSATVDERELAESRAGVCRDAISYLDSASFYFEDLPTGLASVKTDADGEFTMALPRGERIAVAARASRRVVDSVEEYLWLVWVTPDEGVGLMLSNDNMTTTGSPATVVSTPS